MNIDAFPEIYREILLYCSSIIDVVSFAKCSKATYNFVFNKCDTVWKHFYYTDYRHDFSAIHQDKIVVTVKYWEKTAQETKLENKRAVQQFHQSNGVLFQHFRNGETLYVAESAWWREQSAILSSVKLASLSPYLSNLSYGRYDKTIRSKDIAELELGNQYVLLTETQYCLLLQIPFHLYGGDVSMVWWPKKADNSAVPKPFFKDNFFPGATSNWRETYLKRSKYNQLVANVKSETKTNCPWKPTPRVSVDINPRNSISFQYDPDKVFGDFHGCLDFENKVQEAFAKLLSIDEWMYVIDQHHYTLQYYPHIQENGPFTNRLVHFMPYGEDSIMFPIDKSWGLSLSHHGAGEMWGNFAQVIMSDPPLLFKTLFTFTTPCTPDTTKWNWKEPDWNVKFQITRKKEKMSSIKESRIKIVSSFLELKNIVTEEKEEETASLPDEVEEGINLFLFD